jgi:hypothetical protein
MTPADLLSTLTAAGLSVREAGGKLLVSPKGSIPDELAALVRENREGLLGLLAAPAAVEWLLTTGEVVQSVRPNNWLMPSSVLGWRVPPAEAWEGLQALPSAWGLGDAEMPLYDVFRGVRVTKMGTCFHCGNTDFWASAWGVRRCRWCVPPAPGAEAGGAAEGGA